MMANASFQTLHIRIHTNKKAGQNVRLEFIFTV